MDGEGAPSTPTPDTYTASRHNRVIDYGYVKSRGESKDLYLYHSYLT